ncbi:MAG: hypothetical protein ACE5JL_02870 [Dehalococcoidia bacterium]
MKREELVGNILEGVQEPDIVPFKGRVPLGMGKGGANALVFKVTCRCGVTAMLTVDMPTDSSEDKVKEMIPHLAAGLDRQAKQFHRLPCEMHSRISIG